MTTIELKNCPGWTVDLRTDDGVQNSYGYPYLHTYSFCRDKDCIFHFRSLEELHPLQLERIVNLYTDGENFGRQAYAKAFQEQVGKTIDTLGLRPLLTAVLRELMGGPHI